MLLPAWHTAHADTIRESKERRRWGQDRTLCYHSSAENL